MFKYLSWAIGYMVVATGCAVLVADITGFPQHDAQPLLRQDGRLLFPWLEGFWAVAPGLALRYAILRLPLAPLEALLLIYLYRSGSRRWRLWSLGIALPVVLELAWQALFGGAWLGEAWAWLWHWRNPPEFLLDLDLVWANAISNLVPPFVAGALVSSMVRYQATKRS